MGRIKPILGLLVILLVISASGDTILKPSSQIISYTRMYADDFGRSHFKDETINLEALSYVPNFKVTPFTQASSVGFFMQLKRWTWASTQLLDASGPSSFPVR